MRELDIKKGHLIKEAVKLFLDNSYLSNREVARQIGVSEATIRDWKKQPFWEEIKQEILTERAKEAIAMLENNRQQYIKELEEQQEKLKVLREGLINMTAHATKLSSKAYAELSKQEDSIKACGKATKSGVHYHSRVSMEGTSKIAQLNEDIYKLGAVLEFLEDLKEKEEGNSDAPL